VDANAVIQSGYTAAGPLGILNADLSIKGTSVDATRRLKLVYGSSIHGPLCPRYQAFNDGDFAQKPGDPGCLQFIGCKGPATLSLCAVHGWNSTNPENDPTWEYNLGSIVGENGNRATFCISAGHPCMACTEKGYPDNFVPFVNR
jgi:hydrogenase small subunit